jgi:hypothetical protein
MLFGWLICGVVEREAGFNRYGLRGSMKIRLLLVTVVLLRLPHPAADRFDAVLSAQQPPSDCTKPYRNPTVDGPRCGEGSFESRNLPPGWQFGPPPIIRDPRQLRQMMLGPWEFTRELLNWDRVTTTTLRGALVFTPDGRYGYNAVLGDRRDLAMEQEGQYRIALEPNESLPTLTLTPLRQTQGSLEFATLLDEAGLFGRARRKLYLGAVRDDDASLHVCSGCPARTTHLTRPRQ